VAPVLVPAFEASTTASKGRSGRSSKAEALPIPSSRVKSSGPGVPRGNLDTVGDRELRDQRPDRAGVDDKDPASWTKLDHHDPFA
jgi:hypothetical protein